jgi:23S rRNA pseudouridine1911/1915/1917 synthase
MENNAPYILDETADFAVVFKPPGMHSAPLQQKEGGSLLEWYKMERSPCGGEPYDLMHRLDFETQGLVLIAKNLKSYDFFKSLQDNGEFVKEYSALCINSGNCLPAGFPSPPALTFSEPSPEKPLIIMSYFRPYGPGRKQVRPVTDEKKYRELAKDKGGFYRTEITGINGNIFTARIKRGFRHQIRCHLCWIGKPILNDPLYPPIGEAAVLHANNHEANLLALRAHALFFTDPSTGKKREFRIENF